MKSNLFSIALLAALTLSGCQQAEQDLTPQQRTVSLTVTANRGDATRSILSENEGNLDIVWQQTDKLLVTDANGNVLGQLDNVTEGEQSDVATFSGEIETTLDGNANLNFIYTAAGNAELVKNGKMTLSYANQGGTIEWLNSNDFFSASTETVISNGTAAIDLTLERRIAFARFSLNFDEVSYGGEDVNISGPGIYTQATITAANGLTFSNPAGTEGVITVSSGTSDFYVAILPGEEAITPTFTVTIDGQDYTVTLPERKWKANEYVRGEDGDPMEITLEPLPAPVDDTVGPTLTVNVNGQNKKFKFTRGNLAYTLPSSPTGTGTWRILEEQTYFVNAGGLGTDASFTSLGTTPNEIGLFAWGATGLEDARKPWTLRKGSETGGEGSYWPSNTSSNSSYKNLWANDFVYDWGRAYMESGRAADDNRMYITPSMAVFEDLMNQCFVQGCTVTGAGMNGEDVKGLLCIPGITTLADAKALITATDGVTNKSTMTKPTYQTTGSQIDYAYITITDPEAIKKLNNAIFFPAASKRNLNGGSVYNSNNKGYYWTKEASSTNAYNLWFDGAPGGIMFNTKGSNNSSMGRFNQMAVRLLVEVTE